MMMQLEDPSIIIDLRANNGFKGKKFDGFWDEMEAYFNEVNISICLLIMHLYYKLIFLSFA